MKYKKLYIDMFKIENSSKRFKSMLNQEILTDIFNFLSNEKQIIEMIESTKSNRPALEAVIINFEALYSNDVFDIKFNHRNRQLLGSMTRFIMGFYNYFPGKAKSMKAGKYIKTAIVYYRYNT